GRTYCLRCGNEVKKDTVDEVADAVLALGEGTPLNVVFPLRTANANGDVIPKGFIPAESAVRSGKAGSSPLKRFGMTGLKGREKKKKTLHDEGALDATRTRLFELRQRGFNRLFQAGQIFEFSTPESLLDINFAEPVFVLVDRIAVSADSRARIVDATEISFREAGEVIFEAPENPRPNEASMGHPVDGRSPRQMRFSQRFECKTCGIRYEEPEPRLFSFNNPYGACPRCQGFGNTIDFDLGLVIPDPSKSLNEGAI